MRDFLCSFCSVTVRCALEADISCFVHVCIRCQVVSQFNDGLYDIIIAADERTLDDPQTVSADASTSKKYK